MYRQGLFNRHDEFVVVKHKRVSASETLIPGDRVDKSKFRLFHLMSLFRRRIIGVADSEWAKTYIDLFNAKSKLIPEFVKKKQSLIDPKPKQKNGKGKAKLNGPSTKNTV